MLRWLTTRACSCVCLGLIVCEGFRKPPLPSGLPPPPPFLLLSWLACWCWALPAFPSHAHAHANHARIRRTAQTGKRHTQGVNAGVPAFAGGTSHSDRRPDPSTPLHTDTTHPFASHHALASLPHHDRDTRTAPHTDQPHHGAATTTTTTRSRGRVIGGDGGADA